MGKQHKPNEKDLDKKPVDPKSDSKYTDDDDDFDMPIDDIDDFDEVGYDEEDDF